MTLAKENLIYKYNVPAPRYTSYSTVPYWDADRPAASRWFKVVKVTFTGSDQAKGIGSYIHLPFC